MDDRIRKRRRAHPPLLSRLAPAAVVAVERSMPPPRNPVSPPHAYDFGNWGSYSNQRPGARDISVAHGHSDATPADLAAGDFDCPIRASPHGSTLCGWKPRDGDKGFPDIARVKAHIGDHGLVCDKCSRRFSSYKHFSDHGSSEQCDDRGMVNSAPTYPLKQSAAEIDSFFEKHKWKKQPAVAWLEGYRSLWPMWASQGNVPSPFYRHNKRREAGLAVTSPIAELTITGSSYNNAMQRAQDHDSLGMFPVDNDISQDLDSMAPRAPGQWLDFISDIPQPEPLNTTDFMSGAIQTGSTVEMSVIPDTNMDFLPDGVGASASTVFAQGISHHFQTSRAFSKTPVADTSTLRGLTKVLKEFRERNRKLDLENDDLRSKGKGIQRRTFDCKTDLALEDRTEHDKIKDTYVSGMIDVFQGGDIF